MEKGMHQLPFMRKELTTTSSHENASKVNQIRKIAAIRRVVPQRMLLLLVAFTVVSSLLTYITISPHPDEVRRYTRRLIRKLLLKYKFIETAVPTTLPPTPAPTSLPPYVLDPLVRPLALLHNTTRLMAHSISRGFDRLDAVTQSRGVYNSTDCIDTARTCGRASGDRLDMQACWCVQIQPDRTLSYYPKTGLDSGRRDINTWDSWLFGSLQCTLNLLGVVLQTELRQFQFRQPIYLILNVVDFPRLFVPYTVDKALTLPLLAVGHPAYRLRDWNLFRHYSFDSGFPDSGYAHENPSKVLQHYPIFSWSVNPLFNFDILVPNRHPGNCKEQLFDPRISRVPWHNKTRTVMFRGTINNCNSSDTHDHRGRFCGVLQDLKPRLEQELNVKIDCPGPFVTAAQQAQSKYLVLLDGAVAAFRSTWYLASGSVILAAGLHVDMRTSLMIPYVHYIPFNAAELNFPDFADALAMVALNDEYAEWVANNARQLGRTLSKHGTHYDGGNAGDKLYWGELIRQYHNRYTFITDHHQPRVNARSGRMYLNRSFTSNRKCADFRSKDRGRNPFVGDSCLDERYICEGKWQDGYLVDPQVRFL